MPEHDLASFFMNWWGNVNESGEYSLAFYSSGTMPAYQGSQGLAERFYANTLKALASPDKYDFRFSRFFELPINPDSVFGNLCGLLEKDATGATRLDELKRAMQETDRGFFVQFADETELISKGYDPERIKSGLERGLLEAQDNGVGKLRENPYYNCPVMIGEAQTTSAPYMVASYGLISKISTQPGRIFEFGTGCGYSLAYLAALHPGAELFGMDYHESLCSRAKDSLLAHDLAMHSNLAQRIKIEQGDALRLGNNGFWKANSPYDVMMFSFMLPGDYNLAGLAESEHLRKGGVIIAPVCKPGTPNSGFLRAAYKSAEGEVFTAIAGLVSFVPAIQKKGSGKLAFFAKTLNSLTGRNKI